MIGIVVNALSIVVGGILGTLFGNRISQEHAAKLTGIFGICAMGMGISSIVLLENMTAVILAIVLGAAVGMVCHIGDLISEGAVLLQKGIAKILGPHAYGKLSKEESMSLLVTIVVLFCASGSGIYGSLDAGMTGDVTILLSKSVLDLFTAAVFACSLGIVVSAIAIPQIIIFGCLFFLAKIIFPLTTPSMIADFKACGGFLLVATGLRIAKIKDYQIADMIPALILVMPLSSMWSQYIIPLL